MPRTTARKTAAAALAVVGYLRVSTEDQHLGPDAQRASILAWAGREGATVVGWHVDHGVSGAAPLDARPGLMAAVAALAAGEASALVVAKRDRLARDVVVAALIEREVARHGAQIVSADGIGDGAGPEAILMRGIMDNVAQYERALIRARTTAALAVKKARGERVGMVPVGYRVAADGRTLEVDPVEAEIIAAVRELRAAGMSLRAIAAELARLDFATRKGGPISHTQVARIIAREAA
jgi:site-specific DNA recombinase